MRVIFVRGVPDARAVQTPVQTSQRGRVGTQPEHRRACRGDGVPVFSPHDPRHRRASLLHLSGVPWARIGEAVGHSPRESADTYTHVMVDETERDYGAILARR